MARDDVRFPTPQGSCAAWLYAPEAETASRPPVIVMAHGLAGERTFRLDAFAEQFVAAGYACLVFDYRHFGDSDGHPRQLVDIDAQLQDWTAAVAYARKRPELDPDRVVLWGTSFSGGHVIRTAAGDPRVAAALIQCPFTDGLASVLAIPPATVLKLVYPALRDLLASWTGRPRVMLPGVGVPGDTALMVAPGALAASVAIMPPSQDGHPRPVPAVAARAALDIPFYFPGRQSPRVRCPILFTVCDRDSVAPAAATIRHAKRAPRAEVRRYVADHFDIYVGDPFDRVVADQLDFLRSHVPLR